MSFCRKGIAAASAMSRKTGRIPNTSRTVVQTAPASAAVPKSGSARISRVVAPTTAMGSRKP